MTTGDIDAIARLLLAGKPVIIPTDTVCGLAILAAPGASPEILFQIKQRPPEKSIPLLVSRHDDLSRHAVELPDWALLMAARHWPGALTLVCKAGAAVPPGFVADDGSIALRMPGHTLVLELLSRLPAPLACTSANISGQPAVSRIELLDPLIIGQVAGVLDDAGYEPGRGVPASESALPSTIVSCLGAEPLILRQGALTLDLSLYKN